MPGSQVLSAGLSCFRSVTKAGCHHTAVVAGGKHPNDLPQFRWINTLLGNLKTGFNGTFHVFNFDKYARRYLSGYCFRFNRRFSMVAMPVRIANAVCCCKPSTGGSQGRGCIWIIKKLQEKKPVLTRLAKSIPWESFRTLLDNGNSQECKSNAGRKRIDPTILLKMLVLQQLFNLSDEEIELQVDR